VFFVRHLTPADAQAGVNGNAKLTKFPLICQTLLVVQNLMQRKNQTLKK
jgi:hypothetical protein